MLSLLDLLSSDWEGYTLTSQITKADKTINILLDKNNAGMIPPDMEEGIWNVSLFGVKDGSKRNTTIPATLKLVKSGYNPQGQPPIQPPEDLYAKLIKQIDEANKIAQSVRDDADAGKFDGKDGADGKDGKCVRVQRIAKETIVGGFNIVQRPDASGRYYNDKNILKNMYKSGSSKSMCNIATWRSWSKEDGDVKTNNWFALVDRNMYFTPKGNVAD